MSRSSICAPGACWQTTDIVESNVLVDADIYYSTFCRAALLARRYIYITGWQFDTQARLLRPGPDTALWHPLELLPFLNHLCERTPELEIYLTAWDYSLVYALEREWMQKLKFSFQSHPRVHFEFLDHPEGGGCHHQKLVIVDGHVAFLGGLDLCDARWDTREHTPDDPERFDVDGKPYKPFHDVQLALRGPVVGPLIELFAEGWRRAAGDADAPLPHESAEPRSSDPFELRSLAEERGLPLRASRVALSRTELVEVGQPPICEVQRLLERAIQNARKLIYIENQYFTSRAIAEALTRRLTDPDKGKLQLVLVMPNGADSPKEDLVLGNRQRAIRSLVAEVARKHGHELRLLMSSPATEQHKVPATFIHSKVLIVDDEFVTIGSANLTNRSMRVDRELNASFETSLEDPDDAELLRQDIRALRASLLAEHAGTSDSEPFLAIDGLIERIDETCNDPGSKLRCQDLSAPDADDPVLIALFDPSAPLDWSNIDDTLETAFDTHEGFLRKSAQKVGQRLGVVDIE